MTLPPLNPPIDGVDLSGIADSEQLTGLVPIPRFDLEQTSYRARMTRIFQIGFNKCGTRSLYRFLQRSAISSAHFNRGYLAHQIAYNIEKGRAPLHGRSIISDRIGYTDIQHVTKERAIEGIHFFKELYHYYPLSYFILNTRDQDGWIKSRLRHGAGNYAERYRRALDLSDQSAVVDHWKQDWDNHHAAVLDFFKKVGGRLLLFDIKHDNPQKLVDFLSPDFFTKATDFRHEGETARVDGATYADNRPVSR